MAIPFVTEIAPAYGQAVELSPMVRRVVCKNPGRFTFTGTGTYIVGHGQVAVIDPGPDNSDHLAAILSAVAGEEVSHIVITHTHRDHSPASAALQTATGAPTHGFGPHPLPHPDDATAMTPTSWNQLLPTDAELTELKASMQNLANTVVDHASQEERGDMAFTPDVEINHGDEIKGGTWTLVGLHTPGHISNHLCFGLKEEPALFSGDHVMGWSTTVIPPLEGSMADYMSSLELILHRNDEIYYPTHGPPIEDPLAFTHSLIEHRLKREIQILECLATGPKTIPEMVTAIYSQTTPHILHMAAGQSTLSHVLWLIEKGAVSTDGALTADSLFKV